MMEAVVITVPNKPLFFVSEAAVLLGISAMSVYRMIERGDLETHLRHKPYRIPRAALVKHLAE
jgi:excisionase family DNA binding protein